MELMHISDVDLFRSYIEFRNNKHKDLITFSNNFGSIQISLETFKKVRIKEFENLTIKSDGKFLYLLFTLIFGQQSNLAILDINSQDWKLIKRFDASEIIDIIYSNEANTFFIAEQIYNFNKPMIQNCKKIIISNDNQSIEESNLKKSFKAIANNNEQGSLRYDFDAKKLYFIESGALSIWE